jgi:hypothetical protein
MIKSDVGINAGVIWHLLSEKGTLNFDQIKKSTNLEVYEVMLALGWLSRENKINFSEKGKEMYVSLSSSQFYF